MDEIRLDQEAFIGHHLLAKERVSSIHFLSSLASRTEGELTKRSTFGAAYRPQERVTRVKAAGRRGRPKLSIFFSFVTPSSRTTRSAQAQK